MSEPALEWEVALPERGSRRLGQARPRARLRIGSERDGEELVLPVAVGRRLEAGRRAGELAPSCRAELLWLVGETSRSCGRSRVEDLVCRRDYACRELADKLSQDGYAPTVVSELVGRAREAGLVDDARFAAAFARSKVAAGWGRARIARELERRGISAGEVPGWPEEFCCDEDERERAGALARRRRLTGRNDVQKIARFLCGRGFAMGLALDVAREVVGAEGEPFAD